MIEKSFAAPTGVITARACSKFLYFYCLYKTSAEQQAESKKNSVYNFTFDISVCFTLFI